MHLSPTHLCFYFTIEVLKNSTLFTVSLLVGEREGGLWGHSLRISLSLDLGQRG